MTDEMSQPADAYAERFERFERFDAIADANTAAHIRDEFAGWLRRSFDLGTDRAADLVLSVYEALANSVEFAYLSQPRPGTMDVRAFHDATESAVTVTVFDRGRWRTAPTTSGNRTRGRGRGIALMKALSDRASIHTSTDGTRVSLVWTGVHRRPPTR